MSNFFPLPSPSKTCVLPFNFALERDPKNIFFCQRDIASYMDQVLNFFYDLIDINTYTMNLPVCNSGLYTYVTSLYNFFFAPRNLTERIDSSFQRIAFQRNVLLIG